MANKSIKQPAKRYRKKKNTARDVATLASASASAENGGAAGGQSSPPPQNSQPRQGGGNGRNGGAGRNNADFLYLPTDKSSLLPSEFARSAMRPYRLAPRRWREEAPHIAAVFFIVFLLYAFTVPHLVTLEDDGLFIANLHFFGVAHPPGYPIHTFLGGIFYHLMPFGSPAFKGHLFSGFAGAVACAAVYAATVMVVRGRVFGYIAGLSYGASKTFWSQAIIAEVYTLNAMFFFIIFALCIAYASHVGRSGVAHRRLLYLIAFVYGLAAANHYPLLGLGTIGLALLVLPQFYNILPNIPKALAMLFLGLAPPYAWMVWRSHDLSPANFYGPIETLDSFMFYVLRSGYSGVDKQAGVGWADKLIFGQQLGEDMLWQFTPLGFFFVVLGFFAMARSRYNWLWLSMTASWFCSSVLLVYMLDFQATYIWLAAFRVYHLLAYGIMAIWLAFGAAWAVDNLRRLKIPFLFRRQVALLLAPLIAGGAAFAHWDFNNRRDYRWAHDLAMAKINSVEPDSILFTFDDLDLPIGYLHYVEGVRPDLTIYNDQGLVHGNRLYSPLIPDHAPEQNPTAPNKAAYLQQLIKHEKRPIYHHPHRRTLYEYPGYGSDLTGFFRKVNTENAQERVILSDYLRQWLADSVNLYPTDLWTRKQHYSTIAQLVNTVLLANVHGFQLDDRWQEVIDRARQKNAMARLLTDLQSINTGTMSDEELARELAWTETFDIETEELMDRPMKSNFYLLRANLLLISQHKKSGGEADEDTLNEYEAILQGGLDRYRRADNPILLPLLDYYIRNGKDCEFIKMTEEFYKDPDTMPPGLLRSLRQTRQKAICSPAPAADDAV